MVFKGLIAAVVAVGLVATPTIAAASSAAATAAAVAPVQAFEDEDDDDDGGFAWLLGAGALAVFILGVYFLTKDNNGDDEPVSP